MAQTVLFITTTFDAVTNGPGVYSQNLWSFFADDADIDFHLVATESQLKHPKIHTLNSCPRGLGSATYAAINRLAKATALALGPRTIIHANMAHLLTPRLAELYRSIVQVNDTEVCNWTLSPANLRQYGFRRNAALFWRRSRERAVVEVATRVICNSEYTTKAVQTAYSLPRDRLCMIYKAIDLEPFFKAGRIASESLPLETPTIAFIGSNWRLKGLDVLLHALASLVAVGTPVRCVVFGNPDTSTRKQFAELAANLGIAALVEFAGRIDRAALPGTLAGLTALAMPSRNEALGLAAIEALAVGIPVVASSVGGIPEIVRDDSLGQLVPPNSPNALADAIRNVLHSPNTMDMRAIRQQSISRFQTQRLAAELRRLYSTVGNA